MTTNRTRHSHIILLLMTSWLLSVGAMYYSRESGPIIIRHFPIIVEDPPLSDVGGGGSSNREGHECKDIEYAEVCQKMKEEHRCIGMENFIRAYYCRKTCNLCNE